MGEQEIDGVRAAMARLETARRSGDRERVAQVLASDLWPLLSEHFDETIAALNDVDAEAVDRHPSIRFGTYLALLIQGRASWGRLPGPAPLFSLTERTDAERDQLLAQQMMSARFRGDAQDAIESASRLRSRLRRPHAMGSPSPYDLPPLLWLQVGFTELLAGNTSQAIADLGEARRASPADGTDPCLRAATAMSALAHAMRGTLDDALRLLRDAARLPPTPGALSAHVEQGERLARAIVAVERLDADATDLLDGAESVTAIDELWPILALARGHLLLAEQRPESALELVALSRTSRHVSPESPAADILTALSIDAFLALDELSAAGEAAHAAAPGSFSHTARIRLHLRMGEVDRAAAESHRIIADASAPLDQRAEALLLESWATVETGASLEQARAITAARLATHSRLRRIFTTIPRPVVDEIARHLPDAERAALEAATSRLPFVAAVPARPRLTARESIVLAALPDHAGVTELAEVLFVSRNTVKSQLRSIYRKLEVSNRADALAEARRLNLIPPPGSLP